MLEQPTESSFNQSPCTPTGCRVLKLLQMLVDDTMQSHADFSHDPFRIFTVQITLNLLYDRNDLLNDVLTCGRCHSIEIAVRLKIGLALLRLQVSFDPACDRIY